MAQRHKHFEVLELPCSDTVLGPEGKHRQRNCRAPPQALMPEGAVVLHYERWRSAAPVLRGTLKAHNAILSHLCVEASLYLLGT